MYKIGGNHTFGILVQAKDSATGPILIDYKAVVLAKRLEKIPGKWIVRVLGSNEVARQKDPWVNVPCLGFLKRSFQTKTDKHESGSELGKFYWNFLSEY